MFEAGPYQILRAPGIHREIGLGVDGPGGAGEMERQVYILHTRP
jgi:hypothetical protein